MNNKAVPTGIAARNGERKRGFWLAIRLAVAQVIALGCASVFWSWQAGLGLELKWGYLLSQPPLQVAACLIVVAPILLPLRKMTRSSIRMRDVFTTTQLIFWGVVLLPLPIKFVMSIKDALDVVGH